LHPDDERTIRDFLNGDPSAVARVERWIGAAARPYRSRLHSHLDDVRQDILAELTKLFGEDRFRGESTLISYVWRITNHACLRQLRTLQRWIPDGHDVLDQRADEGLSPADRLLEQDRVETIQKIANLLPEECNDLWRRILAGQSYEAMSAALNLAAGTLRVRVLRCRRKAMELRDKPLHR
jgi:RNA polymerase sigma factor (sigma-70 family)